MKRILIAIICLVGCKSNQQESKEVFENIMNKHVQGIAEKQKAKLKLYSLDVVKVDTIDENKLDTWYMTNATVPLVSYYSDLVVSTSNRYKQDLEVSYLKQMKEYNDSMNKYVRIDELLQNRVEKRQEPEVVYQVRAFVKATYFMPNDTTYKRDTSTYFFDKNKSFIDIGKFADLSK